jgi:tetratricopeptide (TPR) repeat protein/class 3 adenylate cyclase
MKKLVPSFILNQIEEKNSIGHFAATALFIDISGFTLMTDALMRNGKEGAEILIDVINKVFAPAVEAIEHNQGFVSTFGGDAFNAVFMDNSGLSGISAAIEINQIFRNMGLQNTKFGSFHISVKIGISYGNIDWGIVLNTRQNAYYFKGEAIDNCAKCEKECVDNQIIFDNNLRDQIPIVEVDFIERGDGYFLLKNVKSIPIYDLKVKDDHITENSFMPKSVLDLKVKGEFRNVISCFISFEEKDNFSQSISDIIDMVYQFGGYFNRISFGDKGGFLLVFFGAPITTEKLYTRACDFALAVQDMSDISTRIGLTYGTAFAGFTGSEIRQEYTCHGNRVNLAARFMMKSNFGEIYIDEYIYAKIATKYDIETLDRSNFKGFTSSVPVYLLSKKHKDFIRTFYNDKIVGREKELQDLREMIQPIFDAKFGGIVYIDGIAGIGKSRLVNQLRSDLGNNINWFYLPCDEILHKSFNPVIHFLKGYFGQSEKNSEKSNKLNFVNILDNLMNLTADEEIRAELIRTKSILGSLLDLHWKDSLFEKLDAKGRYENFLHAFKFLLKAEILQNPVIIELEDGHWIDSDTLKLLTILTRNVEEYPFIIISSCRYNDDGSEFIFGLKGIRENRLNIEYLSKAGSAALIQSKLDGIIPQDTIELISNNSEGNPFYIEQIILYLKENNLLEKNELKSKTFEIPTKINSIIIARIDRLTLELKEVVKTASILGREFAVNVLSNMLQNMPLNEYLAEGEKETIWDSISEISYLFHHALIREAVYEMQLKQKLRELHKLAADTIEDIYKDNLKPHLYELANHYEKSEIQTKAIEYLGKAGDYAKENYQNDISLNYYIKLLNLLPENAIEQRIKFLQKKADVLQFTGRWEEAEEILHKAYNLSINLKNKKLIAETQNKLGLLLRNRGALDQAYSLFEQALEIFTVLDDKLYISNSIGSMGTVHHYKGNFDKAMEYYNRALAIKEKINDKAGMNRYLGNIGIIYDVQGNKDKAMKFYKHALAICEEIGDKSGIIRHTGNMGNYYYNRCNYVKAMECYQKQLVISQERGDKSSICTAVGNIGSVYKDQDKIDKAMECYQQQITIARELDEKSSISSALGNIGLIFSQQGDYNKALEYYQQKLVICKDLGDKNSYGIAIGNIGRAYANLKEYDMALEYFDNAIKVHEEIGFKYGLTYWVFGKAECFFEQKHYSEAKRFIEESITISEEISKPDVLFRSRVLAAQIDFADGHEANAMQIFIDMFEMDLSEDDLANLSNGLLKMINEITDPELHEKYILIALKLYRKLNEKRPNVIFQDQITELEKL